MGSISVTTYSSAVMTGNSIAQSPSDIVAIDVADAFANAPPPVDFVLPGLMAGTVGTLVSPGGMGKSMWCLEACVALAGGPDLIGLGPISEGSAVYFAAEDPALALRHRLYQIGQDLNPSSRAAVVSQLRVVSAAGHAPDLASAGWRAYISECAAGARLVILDTLRMLHRGDENSSSDMTEVLHVLKTIAADTGAAIVCPHHTTKSAALTGKSTRQQASRGSSVLADNVRWAAYLATMTERDAERYQVDGAERQDWVKWGVAKQNYGAQIHTRWLKRRNDGVLHYTPLAELRNNGHTKTRRPRVSAAY